MKPVKTGISGTMESSDIMITLEPSAEQGIQISLKSAVEKQFGPEIRQVITKTLEDLEVTQARVTAVDKGALDCVIRARVRTAAYRACESGDYRWEVANP